MKARLPKSYKDLPQSEKDTINRVMTAKVQEEVDRYFVKLQKIWLQMACIVLSKNFDFDSEKCLLFLANWREMYRVNNSLKTEAEQTEYITAELDKVFGKGGYPTEFIAKLEELR